MVDQFEEDDVIEIKNFSVNVWKDDQRTGITPGDINFRDLYPPLSQLNVVKEEDIPDHLKTVTGKTSLNITQ